MKSKAERPESSGKKRVIGIAVGGIFTLTLAVFLFFDWRVKDICKWSHFEEMPNFSKRIDLISSIFKRDLYHIYFVQDYKDYTSKEKLLEDVNRNQKEIVKQLKKAGFRDDEITISSPREIYTYKGATPEPEKTLFEMKGVAIDIKTKNKKLYYELLSGSVITISQQNIHTSLRPIFSFSITQNLLKVLDCSRIHLRHATLIEEKHSKTKSSQL